MRNWLAYIVIVRALGQTGQADAGELWRLATRWERKMIIAHLRSQADSALGYMRIEHRRRRR